MSEWKPIDTAPTDKIVKVGKWEIWNDRQTWKVTDGVAWVSWFGIGRFRDYHGKEYSHWQEMPPAPGPEE